MLMAAMTIMDARPYDPARERQRRIKIISVIVVAAALAALAWSLRYWPEERAVGHFFGALQAQDYPGAYRLYHPDTAKYPYNEFYQDWGPGGPWGVIKNYKIFDSGVCPHGSGVVVDVVVNGRAEHAQIWVEPSDKSLSIPPCELQFR